MQTHLLFLDISLPVSLFEGLDAKFVSRLSAMMEQDSSWTDGVVRIHDSLELTVFARHDLSGFSHV